MADNFISKLNLVPHPSESGWYSETYRSAGRVTRHEGQGDYNKEPNQPTLPHGLGSNFVTPPKILNRQLTGYCTSLASSPMGRDNKHGWYEKHEKFVTIAAGSLSSVLLIGDSLVNGLARYHRVWSKYFKPLRALNFGVGGDRTQHVLWRIENGEIPLNLQVAFVHCGTNNLDRDNPDEIRDGIASIVYTIQERKPNANFIVSGLLPRDQETSFRRDKIKLVNQKLRKWCQSGKVRNVHYLKPDKDWTEPDGRLVERYYFSDFLHLVEEGYEKFAKSIYEAIEKVSQGNVTTVLPNPKPSATLPPPTAIAPKLKTPPAVTSTIMPTIPPTTTSPLIMTTQPTATLPLTPTIPPTVPLTKQLNTAITNTKNTNTTNTSNITSTAGTNMTCTDLNTNTCTDTSTDLRSKTQMTTYTKTHIGFSTDIHNGSLTNTRTATGTDIYNKTHTVPCIDTKTNSRTATQTNLPTETDTNTSDTNKRIYRKKNLFYNFYLFCLFFIIGTNFVFNTKGPKNNEFNFSFYNSTLRTFNNKFLDVNLVQGLGTIAMGGNGTWVSEMTYTVYAPLPKIQFTLLHIRETESYPKLQKLNPNFHMAKTILLPIFSLFLITLGHWLERKSPFRYTNIRFRYLFLKSRKHAPPKRILYAFSKLIMFLFIASTFDAKTPSKAHYDLEVEIKEQCELFTDQYIEISEIIRSTNLREQCSLYALSKLKFSKRLWYLKYLLLLSGDINLHPGPVKCPCLVCSRSVRKREISCDKCGLWVHKKCKSSTNLGNEHPFICNQCLNNENDISQNAWNLFPFANDFFCNNTSALPVEKTVDDLDEVLSKDKWNIFNKRGLHMIHLNINSVLSKIDELRVVAKKSKAAVIGVTESKLDATVLDGEVNIDGYEVIRSDRNRHGGGVACYVRNDISFNIRSDFSDEIENIVFDMLLPKTKPILVGFLYRPPDQSKFLDKLSTAISRSNTFDNQEVYILGDLNINLINKQKHIPNGIKRYKEFCSLYGLEQLISTPTRVTKNSSSILDHILTNSTDRVSQSGVIDTGLSDHQLIYCTRKITRTKFNSHKNITIRSLKNYSQDVYLEELNKINFPDYSKFTDINDAYSDFIGKVSLTIDKIAPMKEIRIKNSSKEWFDEEIMEEIEKRDKLLAKFKKSRQPSDSQNYKIARNKVQGMIKKKQKNFITEKLNQNIGKPKELWKSLKSLGLSSKQQSSSTICLEKDGILSFDHKANAEIFKDFYSNLASDLVKKLPNPPNKFGTETVREYYKNLNLEEKSFAFEPTTHAVVLKLLEELNPSKSVGLDNIAGKFLKEGASILASPLTDLCNLSISLSSFPDECKVAKLKPLYKKETKTKPKNYRPISLLPLISKIIERIIHSQTQSFLDENKILYTYQSGFRKHYSTDTCLSYLTDRLRNGFEKGLLTGMILIDLQKAFDTIDHSILLEKMKCLSFSESTIRWFTSYLSNRSFIVSVGKELSSRGKLNCGVPQGSILGPLLFLLYVNDMPQAVNSELLLYADDTCLFFMGKDSKIIGDQLNKDFNSLCEWFIDNKLSIHFGEEKTKSILFGTKQLLHKGISLNIRYGDTEIKQHTKVTYLGCILDNDLSGESMVTKVLSLINGRLKFLYRKQKFFNYSLRRLLCNALIQPHYDYACSAWYPSLNKRLLKKIQISQNKCIRYCLKLDNRAHIGANEFKEINWLPTKERVSQCICVNIFKSFNNMAPDYTSEIFHPSHSRHNTRMSTYKLDLPFRKNVHGQKTLSYLGPKTWNSLPAQIKLCKNVNNFKHDIKNRYFKRLQKSDDSIFMYY